MKSNYEKGVSFEKKVALLYQKLGYIDVEHNIIERKFFDRDKWQIDIRYIDPYKKLIIYAECKYKENGRKVTRKEISNFIFVLRNGLNVGMNQGEFITNTAYDEGAIRLARKYELKIINGRDIDNLERKITRISKIYQLKNSMNQIIELGLFNYFQLKSKKILEKIIL